MNKTKRILLAASLLILLIGGYAWYKSQLGSDELKTIHVTIMNEETLLYDQHIQTNASTLSELLTEMKEKKMILLETENSSYGMFIVGMGVDELYLQNESEGKYWTYDSKNNRQCIQQSFCDAADVLVIEDKDEFVFTLKGWNENE